LSQEVAIAAETTSKWPRRRRTSTWRRALGASVPYWLILPVIVTVGLVLAYPIYRLVRLSFQHYGLFELIQHKGKPAGLSNYASIFHDQIFWHTLVRTVIFTVVNVGLTIVIGTLLALLLVRVSRVVQIMLTTSLVLVWSMPIVVATQVWLYVTDYENGILNYVLTQLQLGDFYHHDWYATTFSQLSIVTAVIVWGAIPFVTITVYAALAQVPHELVEAAEIDGARPRRVFFDVTFPILKPVLLILTSLSIIWDFSVFAQPFLIIGQSKLHPGNFLMGVYLFEEGYLKTDFGRGAAISIVMLLIVAALSVFYVRRMVKMGDVR
jgi:N,N'-diacetylchitobiose transport system permease protein